MSTTPTPITDRIATKGDWVQAGLARDLEIKLTEAREQRDRLANAISAWDESLDLCECDYGCDGRMPLQGEKCAKCRLWDEVLAAIAAVKGGDTRPDAPSDSGWIEWHGGECPVQHLARISIRFRDNPGEDFDTVNIGLYWDHRGEGGDIVAYRVKGGAP